MAVVDIPAIGGPADGQIATERSTMDLQPPAVLGALVVNDSSPRFKGTPRWRPPDEGATLPRHLDQTVNPPALKPAWTGRQGLTPYLR
jgi:hypothetical protein